MPLPKKQAQSSAVPWEGMPIGLSFPPTSQDPNEGPRRALDANTCRIDKKMNE